MRFTKSKAFKLLCLLATLILISVPVYAASTSGLGSVSVTDWISFGFGIIGAASAVLEKRKAKLPAWAARYLGMVGQDKIIDGIVYASKMAKATPTERQAAAVEYLQKVAVKDLGFALPTSVANLLVEYVYAIWKRTVGK